MVVRGGRDRERLIVTVVHRDRAGRRDAAVMPAEAAIVCCVIANEAAIVWFAVTFVNV